MANPRQPTELIAEVAEKMDEVISTSSDFFDSAKTLKALNYAQSKLYRELVIWDARRFLTSYDISLVADTQEYAFPNDFLRVKRMEVIGDNYTSLYNASQLPYVDFHEGQEYWDGGAYSLGSVNTSLRWTIRNNSIRFLPKPSISESSAVRLWYYKKPIDMHTGTASAGSASSITLDSTPTIGDDRAEADYFNLATIITTGGTGSGQTAAITDFTAARVASATFSTAPDSTTTYEILSMFEDFELELLVLDAARRLAQIDGPQEVESWARAFGADRAELYTQFRNLNARRQVNTPRRTRIVMP